MRLAKTCPIAAQPTTAVHIGQSFAYIKAALGDNRYRQDAFGRCLCGRPAVRASFLFRKGSGNNNDRQVTVHADI